MTAEARVELPGAYFERMAAEIPRVAERLAEEPAADLSTLEGRAGWRHFPSAILVAAVLYARRHPASPRAGDRSLFELARRIGDLLVTESEAGPYASRLDHHRDTYMWLEAYRLLEGELEPERRALWRREIEREVTPLAEMIAERQDFPRYQSPFIGTSPNHYALWASTLYLAGRTFGNEAWIQLGERVLHRFAAEEQSPDGYWGEHSDAGPTPGYDYLTMAGVALYFEHSGDAAVLEALRRSTEFHAHYTFPDGTPVDVINDRNRHWGVSTWGHFGFSHFPEGRRYAAFLTERLGEGSLALEDLGRLAQNALYFHEGPDAPIPHDREGFVHRLRAPAGIRKQGPWVVALSGIVSTQAVTNQFYLDRQGSVSLFHERLGLVLTGANSKGQPELATFYEEFGGERFHLPTSSHLRMRDAGDRLALAYHCFFAEMDVAIGADGAVSLGFVISGKGRVPDHACLNLQLCLKSGEVLETAAGRRIVLGAEAIDLGPAELGPWVRHRGWALHLDPTSRLSWPIYPFNPYANGPETSLERAVGRLTVPLHLQPEPGRYVRPREQQIVFRIEVDGHAS